MTIDKNPLKHQASMLLKIEHYINDWLQNNPHFHLNVPIQSGRVGSLTDTVSFSSLTLQFLVN